MATFLALNQATPVRFPPPELGVSIQAWIRQPAERLVLKASVCGFESHSR